MPSRWTLIASFGGVGLSGFGVWLWLAPTSAPGYVQEKSIAE